MENENNYISKPKSLDVSDNSQPSWPMEQGSCSESNTSPKESLESTGISSTNKHFNAIVNESQKSDKRRWSVRSPLPIRANQQSTERSMVCIGDDIEKHSQHTSNEKDSPCKFFPSLSQNKGSAFERKEPSEYRDFDSNPIKRCNSAPILNDIE